MIEQYITKTRPNLDVPFFEDCDEGRDRSDAIIQLAIDHPELVTSRDSMARPATELVWTATWTFAGFPEFAKFMQLAYTTDPTLRVDRTKYIMKNGQEMLIETQGPESEERVVQIHVTPSEAVRYDGVTMTAAEAQNL